MAKSVENIFTEGISGTIAKKMTMRQVRGETVIGRKNRGSKSPATEKQQSARNKFRKAKTYIAWAMADPDTKAAYEAVAVRLGISTYTLIQKEAFQAPIITEIDTEQYKGRPGDVISIWAFAPFKVVSVKVVILSADSVLLEEGEAVLVDGKWLYTVTGGNPTPVGDRIIVTAANLPGNKAVKEAVLS
jgi:hypothetical protein